MSEKIYLHPPFIQGNEWEYLRNCLDSGWISSAGQYVAKFEDEIAKYTGARYAISCVNGSSALQLSLELGGVSPDDEVIVPSLTFIATVNAIKHNGANPVFMDIDRTGNINGEKTREFIETQTRYEGGYSWNKVTGCRVSAIVPVHVLGNAANLEALLDICEERNIVVVEDAAESLGTWYQTGDHSYRHTGTLGTFGCLSFNGNKIVTSGGGGMILTNNRRLAELARHLTTQARIDDLYYEHDVVGYNYRLTNLQAAVGLAQLERLPDILQVKRHIHSRYVSLVESLTTYEILSGPTYASNNYWLNLLRWRSDSLHRDVRYLLTKFSENDIEVRPLWLPNHLQKPYVNCQTYKLDQVEEFCSKALCLPSGIGLKDDHLDAVINCLYA